MLPTVSMPAIYFERLPLPLSRLRWAVGSSPFAESLRLSPFNGEPMGKLSIYPYGPTEPAELERCLSECAHLMQETRRSLGTRKVPGHAWHAGDLEGGARV